MRSIRKKSRLLLVLQVCVISLLILSMTFSTSSSYAKDLIDTYIYPRHYRAHVEQYAALYGAEPNMIYAIIKAESDFNPDTVSEDGEIGLMQISPETYRFDIRYNIGLKEDSSILYEPEKNIQSGVYYFAKWYRYFGTSVEALAAYSGGVGNVKTWREYGYTDEYGILDVEKIPFAQTQSYVKRVMEYKEKYDALYGHIADQGKRIHPNICHEWAVLYGAQYHIDSRFLMAIIKVESSFDPTCLSHTGASGLMQILRSTYADIQKDLSLTEDYGELQNGKFNIRCGSYYIHWLSRFFEGYEQLAAAYNGGIGTVRKWLDDPDCSYDGKTLLVERIPDEGVRNYVKKVMQYYKEYCAVYRR